MATRFILCVIFSLSFLSTKAEIIALSGVYEGINLYVENDSMYGESCVKDIFVNDLRITVEKDKAFFEIDMSFLKLKDQVSVKIICVSGCKIKILNPEAINLMYGFQFISLNLEHDKLSWITRNEKAGGKYTVELNVSKIWVPIGEISGKQCAIMCNYEKKMETIKHYYYRVKYVDADGISHSSPPVKLHKHH